MDSGNQDIEAHYYNIKGQEVEKDGDDVFAKQTPAGLFVAEFIGSLFVKGTIVKRMDKDRFKMRKVGPLCFKNYLQYLKTNRESRYLMAERNHID
jgi:hypothetical protein